MFIPLIGMSTLPTEIILCEDEIEGKSTSFTHSNLGFDAA